MPPIRFRVTGFDADTTAPEVYDALAKQLALEDVNVDKGSLKSAGGGKQCEFELPDEEADLLRGPYACCKVAVRGITELQFKEIGPSKGQKADNTQDSGGIGVGAGKAQSTGKSAGSGKKKTAVKTSQNSDDRVGRPDYGDPHSQDGVVFPKPMLNQPPKAKGSNVADLGGMDFTIDSTKFISGAPSSQYQPAGGMSFPAPRKAPRGGNESSDSDDDDSYLRAPQRRASWEKCEVSEAAKAPPSWAPPIAGTPPAALPPARRGGASGSAAAAGMRGAAGVVPDTRDSVGPEMAAVCTPSRWMSGEDPQDPQAASSKTDGVPKTSRACTIDYCWTQ